MLINLYIIVNYVIMPGSVFKHLGLFLLMYLLCSSPAQSQRQLAIENAKKFKRITYYPGDLIRFQTVESKDRINGMIEAITDSTIIIIKTLNIPYKDGSSAISTFRDHIPLRMIRAVYPQDQSTWYQFRNIFYAGTIIGGTGLIGVSIANSLIENQVPDFNSLTIVAGIMTAGLAVRYLGRNKYRIGKKWELKSIILLQKRPQQ